MLGVSYWRGEKRKGEGGVAGEVVESRPKDELRQNMKELGQLNTSSRQHNTTQVIKINQRSALIANLKLCHSGKKGMENETEKTEM